jgi:hypothetical protein
MKPYRFGFKAVLNRALCWSLVLASPLSSEICLLLRVTCYSAPDQSTIIVKARLEIKDYQSHQHVLSCYKNVLYGASCFLADHDTASIYVQIEYNC